MVQIKQGKPPLQVAVVGAGFWARFQVRAWRALEREGRIKLVALCGSDQEQLARFQESIGLTKLPRYATVHELLNSAAVPDVVDIITPTPSHRDLAIEVLSQRIPVIVQKPMAQTLSDALSMVRISEEKAVPLLVHENFRWQKPFTTLKRIINERADELGPVVDLRLEYESGGEDYLKGQPYFATQSALVNGEVGVHLVDLIRFLSGRNVTRVCSAQMHRGVDGRYQGEDMAHVVLDMEGGISAAYRVAFSAARRAERPPQTFARIIFERGSIELEADYLLTVTTLNRTGCDGIRRRIESFVAAPDRDPWTQDPALKEYQSWLGQWESCLPTNRACAEYILGKLSHANGVTTAEDNLNVLATTFGGYLADSRRAPVSIPVTREGLEELATELAAARVGYPIFPESQA